MNRALIAILAVLAVVLVVMVMLLRSGGGEPLERPSEDEEQVATESGTSRDLREWQPEVPPSSATPDRSASVPARRAPTGDEDEREEAGRATPVREKNDGEEGDYFDDIRRRYTPEPSREQDEDVRYQSFLEDWMRRQRRLSGDFDRISRRVRAGETELAQRYNDTVDALVNELTETLGAEFAKNFMMRLKTDHIDADTGARLPRPQ